MKPYTFDCTYLGPLPEDEQQCHRVTLQAANKAEAMKLARERGWRFSKDGPICKGCAFSHDLDLNERRSATLQQAREAKRRTQRVGDGLDDLRKLFQIPGI